MSLLPAVMVQDDVFDCGTHFPGFARNDPQNAELFYYQINSTNTRISMPDFGPLKQNKNRLDIVRTMVPLYVVGIGNGLLQLLMPRLELNYNTLSIRSTGCCSYNL
jgi:hypothetical protein